MPSLVEFEPYLKEIEGLFPRPRIMAQLSAKLRGELTTIEEIAELLITDTTMVASIVQMANSSYFNFAEKAASLEEALQRVGLSEIGRMVSVSVANQVYRKELSHYRIPPSVFWESCLAAALLMEAFADARRRDTGEAYLAGLMRETGMLVIDHVLNKTGSKAVWDGYQPVQVWENSVCGYDHGLPGSRLLESWGFPQRVCHAVRNQWSEVPDPSELDLSLKLANQIIAFAGADFSLSIDEWAPFEEAARRCDLSVEQLGRCHASAAKKFARLRALAS